MITRMGHVPAHVADVIVRVMRRPAALLVLGLVTSALALGPVVPASAAPGGEATVVVKAVTIDTTASGNHILTETVMCPAGTRATGGGAYPLSAQADGGADFYRIYYTAPVDESGLASTTEDGDIPRGWQTTVDIFDKNSDGTYRFFAICSATSDAVIEAAQPTIPTNTTTTVVVPCPAGQRAVGGGMGKINDAVIPANGGWGSIFFQTGPVDATGTLVGTQSGDVATGWRVVTRSSTYGNRGFAICSAASDATVATGSFSTAATGQAGMGSATCPAGRRALSGGLAVESPPADENYRPGLAAPVTTISERSNVASGTVARGFLYSSKPSLNFPIDFRVFAVCATDPSLPPPADTSAPQTSIDKGPQTKTFAKKATFTFSSEAGATFTCRLDKKPAAACTSPFKVKKLKVGKHQLTVTAKDGAGNADPTPATYTWKVKKKPKPAPSGCTGECRSAAGGGYTTYVACAKNTADQAEHECDLGSTPVAVFVSKNRDATFKVCAKFPKKKNRLCATAQQADKGKPRLNTITTDKVGTHKVTWYVDGHKVGAWKFDVVEA